MGVRPSTDEMNDITVLRELEKMKKWIIDYTWGRTIDHLDFSYGTGEESNKVTLTVTLLDESVESASFKIKTIRDITTRIEGELNYLVITLSDGSIFETPIDLSTVVNITTDQTIDGNKNFIGGVDVPNIVHEEGEEGVQESNKAVNERFFKIHATERIDAIEDELGDPEHPGTIRGELAEKQVVLVSGENIKTINGGNILGEGDLQIGEGAEWGNIQGNIELQSDLINLLSTLRNSLYPIGSIYINAISDENPQILLGFGSWEIFGSGKVLVGVDTEQTEFNEVGKTGGEKTHTLTVGEIPSHNHSCSTNGGHTHIYSNVRLYGNSGTGAQYSSVSGRYDADTESNGDHSHTIGYTGGGGEHNNLQPYVTVYMWKRID